MNDPENFNEELVNILRKLVQIPTENPPGKTDEIIKFLVSQVFKEENGFQNEILSYKKKDVELQNLVTSIGSGNRKIILSGHFDVVPVGDLNQWTYPPFSAEIVDGKLYGRGSADMKAGLTMLIGTIMNLKENSQFLEKYTLVFLGTADEEAGMTGAVTCVRKGVMKNSELLIIAEPTSMNIGIAEKGLVWVSLDISGKSAHASTPHEGINSIECALKIIPHLYSCLEDKSNDILGPSTINIGKIEGGTVINVVPGKTTIRADYRLIPEQSTDILIKKLRNIDISPCSLEVRITHTLPALQTEVNHPFLQNLKKINQSNFVGLPYATDAAILINPTNPVPFVIYGPGNPKVVHKENEFVKLADLFRSTELLTKAILQTYLNEN